MFHTITTEKVYVPFFLVEVLVDTSGAKTQTGYCATTFPQWGQHSWTSSCLIIGWAKGGTHPFHHIYPIPQTFFCGAISRMKFLFWQCQKLGHFKGGNKKCCWKISSWHATKCLVRNRILLWFVQCHKWSTQWTSLGFCLFFISFNLISLLYDKCLKLIRSSVITLYNKHIFYTKFNEKCYITIVCSCFFIVFSRQFPCSLSSKCIISNSLRNIHFNKDMNNTNVITTESHTVNIPNFVCVSTYLSVGINIMYHLTIKPLFVISILFANSLMFRKLYQQSLYV
jgi:hypothetical protein